MNTGVDFAGPLYVWKGKQVSEQVKAYVCFFTCAATRAVHLELRPDLSADMFLLAFRQFISQSGTPSKAVGSNLIVVRPKKGMHQSFRILPVWWRKQLASVQSMLLLGGLGAYPQENFEK